MDNAPPLNLSTSIKIEESLAIKGEQIEELGTQGKKDAKDYMFIPYGLNNLEDVITITGEPVADNCNGDVGVEQDALPNKSKIINQSLNSANEGMDSMNGLYNCSTCNKSFARANQLRHHEKIHVPVKDLCCHTCSKEFETGEELMNHQSEHIVEDLAVDSNSSMEFLEQPKKIPVKLKEQKKYKCQQCPMSFSRDLYLVIHTRKHTGEKPFECHVCLTKFKQMSHLTTHLRTHTKDRPYVCNICNFSFSQTGSLKRHLRSHTGDRPFKCDICNAEFIEKRNLSRHMLSHTGERPYKCDICTSSFTQLIDLKRHKLSHFGIKPFKCDMCEASFSRRNNLRWHKLTHQGETPFKCDVCQVGFRIARELNNHKRSHSDNKTYYCDKCELNFSLFSRLKRHMKIHSTEESLLCNHCGETVNTQQALMRHIKRHTNDKKFSCDQCLMSFTHMKLLTKHMSSCHSKVKIGIVNRTPFQSDVIKNNLKDKKVEDSQTNADVYQLPIEGNISIAPAIKETVNEKSAEQIPSLYLNQTENSSTVERSSQLPTLVLTEPGHPPRTGRPAGNCQNHDKHIHTMVEGIFDEWQVWCFCELPNSPCTDISSTVPITSCSSSNTHTSIATASTSNNVSMPFQILEPTRYSHPSDYEPVMGQFLPEMSNDHLKQKLHPEVIPDSQVKNTLPCINDSTSLPTKPTLNKSLQTKSVNVQNNALSESTLKEDFSSSNIPINLSDCNNTMDDIKTASIDETMSKKEYLNKNVYKDRYIMSDNKSRPLSNLSSSNSIIDVNSEKRIQDGNYESDGKISLPKSYLSHTLDDKMFLNTEFSSAFLSDEITNKFIATESQLQNNPKYIPKESKKSFGNEELQDFETVFLEEYTSNVGGDKNLPLQYCLTVNNPATGEIQIQSDLFSSKQSPVESSNKKRKLISELDLEPRPSICPYCSKYFTKKSAYECHMRTHTGEKSMMCGICNQCFSHKNSLIVHMRSHTGERPYVCHQCKASFTQKSNLRVHNRTHTGERPFKCNLCDATFSQGSHLKAHNRIHFNHRPFVCQTCNHAFTQKSALKRHEGKHSIKRNNKCTTCEAAFSSKELLKKHSVRHRNKAAINDGESETPSEDNAVPSQSTDGGQVKSEASINSCTDIRPSEHNVINQLASHENNYEEYYDQAYSSKIKHRPAILQPTRRSRRILESASKKCLKRNSDFITGDLDEIDRAEEIENQLVAVKPRNYRKKPNNAEVVQSWCFCEVAHGPNEPHTHSNHETNSTLVSTQGETSCQKSLTENITDPSTDTVYQLSIPNLSHTIVLQGNQAGGNSLPISNDDIIFQSNVADHPIAISASGPHFTQNEFSTVSAKDENRAIFEAGPVINQVYSASQIVTSEGNTLYTLQPEVLNTDTMVLNSSAGPIFFDVSSDGQMLALPMQDNIVVGSASEIQNAINLSGTSTELPSITPVSLNLPIENLQQQNPDESTSQQDPNEIATFDSNNIATAVNFVPLESNFMELFTEQNENIDFESIKVSVSPKGTKKKKPLSVIVIPSQCAVCTKKFAQKSTLHHHMKEMHSSTFYCNYCFEVFSSDNELTAHKVKHSPDKFCNDCNAIFDSKAELNKHRAQVHKMTKVKRDLVNCPPCGAKFSQISDFKRHMQSHLGIKPFACKQCGAAFTRKSSLNKHERIHTGEKPYTCPDCDKTFSYRYQFNRHKADHVLVEQQE